MGPVNPENLKFVPKVWGYEFWISNSEKYCGKILFIKKDKAFSWHHHNLKDETFYIQSGEGHIAYGWSSNQIEAHCSRLKAGDVVYIPPKLWHQVRAITDIHIFEVSTQHFDEDSIKLVK